MHATRKHQRNAQNQLEFELEGFMQRVLIRHANIMTLSK
jgi:hypothetical protein